MRKVFIFLLIGSSSIFALEDKFICNDNNGSEVILFIEKEKKVTAYINNKKFLDAYYKDSALIDQNRNDVYVIEKTNRKSYWVIQRDKIYKDRLVLLKYLDKTYKFLCEN